MIFRLARVLLDPQGGEGNGNGEGSKAPESPATPPDLLKAVEGLVSRHGDPTAALRVLLGENYSLRDKVRETEKRLAPDGSVILTGDDARRWSSYRELGDPSELKKSLGERDQYRTEAEGFRRAEQIAKVAKVSGFRPSVLATLAEKLEIVIAEEKGKDGKAVEVARVKGEGDQTTPLTEYAEKHWADFLPSLRAEPEKARPIGTPMTNRPARVADDRASDRQRPVRNVF